MTETEMMQRVVAILTQAGEMAKTYEENAEREDQQETAGELIAEVLRLDKVVVTDPDPQAVADAVMQALQPRVALLASCFIAAFSRLAFHHDGGDANISSTDMLQRMALEWELDDEED